VGTPRPARGKNAPVYAPRARARALWGLSGWRKLDLTGGAWLSDRVLVSVAVMQRSFSPSPLASRQGRSASGSCRSTNVPDVAVPYCTTKLENAHGTEFRELLYPWHPWFGLRVGVQARTRARSIFKFVRIARDGCVRWVRITRLRPVIVVRSSVQKTGNVHSTISPTLNLWDGISLPYF
jgi:hypothetical protein